MIDVDGWLDWTRCLLTTMDDHQTNRADGQPKYFIRCNKVKPRVLEVRK